MKKLLKVTLVVGGMTATSVESIDATVDDESGKSSESV